MSWWSRVRRSWSRPLRGGETLPVPSGKVVLDGRRVRVRSFRLDARPVTNGDWQAFVAATGHDRPPWMYRPGYDDPEQPIVGVTWHAAAAYARWAGKRLPTEAEWLMATGVADGRRYPWGEREPNARLAHFGQPRAGVPDISTRSEGSGPYGHVDLVGNVWEWCADGSVRGGFWGASDVPIDARLTPSPSQVGAGFGLRCAC